ncbi:uncharacterized protein FIBRA_08991 [Fibroporia radiculosa]|uniref:Cytochrome P450 n=1 Tax=Fibroporia radiculosa TaxID=599839 RepID=J4GIN6_9APHY|nr:uncharacterized protein FIBRA_08991 [Fibroporia radiculosa]CCM06703.1 predicted protein [Fibroporia radiculosa]
MELNLSLCALLLCSLVCIIALSNGSRKSNLSHIPTVGGPSLPILSYYGTIRYIFRAQEIIKEGYTKHKGGIFKYAELGHWRVIVTGPKLIDDLRKAPENVLSNSEAIREIVGLDYTLGLDIIHDPYHIPIIRSRFKGDLGTSLQDVRDEIIAALNDEIPSCSNGAFDCFPEFCTVLYLQTMSQGNGLMFPW